MKAPNNGMTLRKNNKEENITVPGFKIYSKSTNLNQHGIGTKKEIQDK